MRIWRLGEEASIFTVIGEALLDMVQPEPGETFVAIPGGGPLNIAVGLQRLGHPTELMARFSSGPLGAIVRRHAERNGLGLSKSVWTDEPTTLAFATLDETGQASYDFYVEATADWGWTPEQLGPPDSTRVLHTGSVAAAIPPGADALISLWLRLRASAAAVLSFDPNIRPALVGRRDEAVRRVEQFVAASHLVKASDEDLAWLYPKTPVAEAARAWSGLGPDLVVVTRGADGCVGLRQGCEPVELAGATVDVVDTIGAGDAFAAGLLSALADAGVLSSGGLADVSEAVTMAALQRAVTVSAMTCQRAGADPPTRAEYNASHVL